jgi:cytochrome c553
MRTWLLIVVLLAWMIGLARAGDDWNAAQPEQQDALRRRGNVGAGEAAFEACQGCHRVGALGRADGSYPRLAGQHAEVLIKQMVDVRSGRRGNPKMLPFADRHVLSVQNIADLAAYLQALPVTADNGHGSGEALSAGAAAYGRDCARCHGVAGEGDAVRFFPRLAGQHYHYLLRASRMIRDRERRNSHPEMAELIRGYSDDELAAVADYISRLSTKPIAGDGGVPSAGFSSAPAR